MLETDASYLVAQQEQEIIVIVVMRPIELIRLDGEPLVHLQLLRCDVQVLRRIGEEIEMNDIRGRGRQIDALIVHAGIERRIDKCIKRRPFESDGGSILGSGFERGGVLPSGQAASASGRTEYPARNTLQGT